MAKEKKVMRLVAILNGERQGYVKSIYYSRQVFVITPRIEEARIYKSTDALQYDIDFLTKHYFEEGYIFIYEE